MSAKSVTTEAPTTQAGNTINLTSAPAPAGPTEFQSVLAGAGPDPGLIDTLPTQPLAQLIASKQQQAARAATLAAATAGAPVPQGKQSVTTDILKLLTDTATLLPAAGEAAAETLDGRDEASLPEERVETSADILSDWLDAMVPFGVFAPQAGTENSAASSGDPAASIGLGGNAQRQTPVSASLLPQAGIAEREADVAAVASAALAAPMIGRSVELIATNSQLTAAVVALTSRSESESDKPSADGWMSALGDLAAKRGADVVPDLAPRLSTPVHDSRWADAIAHRLVMMAREGDSIAQLKLVPQELGPLDIQITVKDSEASVHFGAANAETRAALEASIPRLRELLSAQGLQLTNASVSQQSGGKNQPERSSGPAAVGALADDGEVSPAMAISTSLLDIYA
ncbi:MAG: flagellar hook-length control protein FliK [Steroidobacteraceae bacterium]|nr:flagellar hook-length control protein FliK [Steroidobacteraceae bacterium]